MKGLPDAAQPRADEAPGLALPAGVFLARLLLGDHEALDPEPQVGRQVEEPLAAEGGHRLHVHVLVNIDEEGAGRAAVEPGPRHLHAQVNQGGVGAAQLGDGPLGELQALEHVGSAALGQRGQLWGRRRRDLGRRHVQRH